MFPRSTQGETDGLRYFARMLDKIRLAAAGNREADYQPNMGRGGDGRMTKFLRVDYEALRARGFF